MTIFFKEHLAEILTFILLLFWGVVSSQVTIDRELAIKLDYMAWKARQLDTTTIKLIDQNKGLNQLINELDTLNAAYSQENKSLVQVVASQQIQINLLEGRYTDVHNMLKDCAGDRQKLEKRIVQQDEKLAKVVSSRNSYMLANMGLGLIVVGGFIAVVTQ
jgi:chromosome segregation ATPase